MSAIRERLANFYKKYNDEKSGKDIDRILKTYSGKEDFLFALLTQKYGPEQSNYSSSNAPLKIVSIPEKYEATFSPMFGGVLLHWFGVVQKNGASSLFGATSGRRIVVVTDTALFLCKEDKGTVSRCLPLSLVRKVTKVTGTRASDSAEFVIHMAAPEFDLRFKLFEEDSFAFDEVTEDDKFEKTMKALYKLNNIDNTQSKDGFPTPNNGGAAIYEDEQQKSPSAQSPVSQTPSGSPERADNGVVENELPFETVRSAEGLDMHLERPGGFQLKLVAPTKLDVALEGL